MSNHIPFLFLKSGNISRKFVTKKMRICDKNFGQLHNTLNSGVDLQFCVTNACMDEGKKEAAYEVLDFLLADENVQKYLDDQKAVPCKTGDFTLASNLDGMLEYIKSGKMADYQDHYYPSEMAVDAQIQTYLIEGDLDAFLNKFDSDWARYNRDIIRMVEEYNKQSGNQ